MAVYDELEELVSEDRRPLIVALRAECLAAIDHGMPPPFQPDARQPDRTGLG